MWPDLGSYLTARYAGTRGAESMARLLRDGRVLGAGGRVLRPEDPYEAGGFLWFHRDMPTEPVVPFPIRVVHRDAHLLVVDKPHFLATTPRGSHVTQTALARLREELDLPELSPAHRLDRMTAGLVMFSIRPEDAARTSRSSSCGRSPRSTRPSPRTIPRWSCRGPSAATSRRSAG